MLIIGDRIDATRKYIAGAITTANRAFIQSEVKAQTVSGADYINVNMAIFAGEETRYLRWVIEVIQECTDLPLCIDSTDPAAIRAALPLLKKQPMINALTLEPARMGGMLPLVVERRTKVIASCQVGNGRAEKTEAKVRIAGLLIEKIVTGGVALDDIYIDPLAYSLSANAQAARANGSCRPFPASIPPAVRTRYPLAFRRENSSPGPFCRQQWNGASTRRSLIRLIRRCMLPSRRVS
jgi:cobalamin-dependent methionine synthase I